MKRLLTTAVLASTFLLSAQVLHAGDDAAKHQRHSPEQKIERMAEKLDLTEEQKQNILVIKKEEGEKIRALREESKTKIESYLTDEQKQKQQQLKEQKRSKLKECKGKSKDHGTH